MPDRFKVWETSEELTLRRRWFEPLAWVVVLFVVGWNAFVWYFCRTSGMWFPAGIFFVPGAGMAYLVLAGFLNITEINVANGRLTLRHLPLPWPGRHDVAVADILQLYCHLDRTPRSEGGPGSVELRVVKKDRTEFNLFKGVHPELLEALFIEQTIERHLGIQDRAMKGEVAVKVGREPSEP